MTIPGEQPLFAVAGVLASNHSEQDSKLEMVALNVVGEDANNGGYCPGTEFRDTTTATFLSQRRAIK